MAEPFIGEIIMFGGNFAPRGWALCDGQLLSISQYSALFSILGTTYGGDGRTTFGLPELRGRSPMHAGTGPGLSPRTLGQKLGAQDSQLTIPNLPAHNHPLLPRCNNGQANSDTPVNAYPSVDESASESFHTAHNADMGTMDTQNTGNNTPFNNIHPVLVVNFIIALVGIYPSR